MASADFCAFSAALQLRLRLSARSAQTSPGTTRFFPSIYLPHLPHAIPCSYWASTCWAALPSHIAFYAVSVRQARGLPVVSLFPHPASFRFRLTTDTLAFGFLLPATGRIRVFHPLETCAAGRTQNAAPSDEFGGGGAQNGSLPKSRISSDRGKGVREGRLPPSSAFACEIAYHTSSR